MQDFSHYLIVDLEATCSNDKSLPIQEMETIEIGAVMLKADTLEVLDEYCTFIRPVRHPQLTAFCTELTSITQQDVDAAPVYAEAIQDFKAWMYRYSNFLFCSWGDYDKRQLMQDSQFHQLPFPIGAPHLNIKVRFSETQGLPKRYGLDDALKRCGLDLEGRHHRGIDDARNMARLMPWITGARTLREI